VGRVALERAAMEDEPGRRVSAIGFFLRVCLRCRREESNCFLSWLLLFSLLQVRGKHIALSLLTQSLRTKGTQIQLAQSMEALFANTDGYE
jgi:hypothetical protein